MTLEAFQSGLSWSTILNKREAFREVFAGFDAEVVAAYDEGDVTRLMDEPRIVRNRLKIEATLTNARATLALREHEGLEAFVLVLRPRDAAGAGHDRGDDDDLGGVGRPVQGAEEEGLRLRRADHDVRDDGGAGDLRPAPAGLPQTGQGDHGGVSQPEPVPVKRRRHLMDPDAPRPGAASASASMSTGSVQRWVMSVLAVTTIGHLSAGLVVAAIFLDTTRPGAQVGVDVIAGLVGMLGVAAGFLIHQKSPFRPWLLLGLTRPWWGSTSSSSAVADVIRRRTRFHWAYDVLRVGVGCRGDVMRWQPFPWGEMTSCGAGVGRRGTSCGWCTRFHWAYDVLRGRGRVSRDVMRVAHPFQRAYDVLRGRAAGDASCGWRTRFHGGV